MSTTDPKKIAEERSSVRNEKSLDERQVMALEDIADVLETIRFHLIAWSNRPQPR